MKVAKVEQQLAINGDDWIKPSFFRRIHDQAKRIQDFMTNENPIFDELVLTNSFKRQDLMLTDEAGLTKSVNKNTT